LVDTRKALRAAIDGFELIPDAYDYAETGQTVSQMWTAGDTDVKRAMVHAIKDSWGLALSEHEGGWGIKIGTDFSMRDANGIVDLGNGLCFRREAA